MLTLFTCPRPMEGEFATIQRNAVRSWQQMAPPPHIVLIGNEPGVGALAEELGCTHIPSVLCDQYGTPLVSDVFAQGEVAAQTEIVAYVNTDILLHIGSEVLEQVTGAVQGPLLVVGRRVDFDLDTTWELICGPDWAKCMVALLGDAGHDYHQAAGIDYFIYRRDTLGVLPPFVLGRYRWDQWIVWHALQRGFVVVDATQVITAVHQNHEVAPLDGVRQEQFWANVQLVEDTDGALCTIDDATHALSRDYGVYRRV